MGVVAGWLSTPGYGSDPTRLLKRKALWHKTDRELVEISERYCAIRGASFADQITTLPFQSRIDEIEDIMQQRRRFGAEHLRILLEWGKLPDDLVFLVASASESPAPPALRRFATALY